MLNGVLPSPHTLEGIQKLTASCDLTFANLEVPTTDSKTRTPRKSADEIKRKDQWVLKADPKHVPYLRQCGIGIVSLANNHAMDFGSTGLRQMISLLDENQILHAGAGENAAVAMQPTTKIIKNKHSVALLSTLGFVTTPALLKTTPATIDSPGVGVLNLNGSIGKKAKEKLAGWIKRAHETADVVVVGIHWGVERKPLPTPYQVALGRALIDAGADIVWGNHPHVLQGAEMYKGHLIMYSMGNLISNLPATTGLFKVEIDRDGKQTAHFYPAKATGSRITLTKAPLKQSALLSMRQLCRLLLRRYPSTVSIPAL